MRETVLGTGFLRLGFLKFVSLGLGLLSCGAALPAETDVPPTASFAIEGLDANVGNLEKMIGRGCNSAEVNSLDRSTEAYLYRAIYLSVRQLVRSEAAGKEQFYANADEHIKNAQQIAERALSATFKFADIGRQNGCLDLADKYYRKIVRSFIGTNYTAERERAQRGINDIDARQR